MYIGFVSRGLLDPTWVYFPLAWFLQKLLGLVSLILAAPTYSIVHRIIPLTFWIGTYFDLGLLSLGLISPKFIGACFAQPCSTNIHIHRILFPWPFGPKQILSWVYFPLAWFLQNLMGLVSLILTALTYTYRIRFPWPSGPKQNLSWVYFPSAWLLQNLMGLVSLSLKACIYMFLYV